MPERTWVVQRTFHVGQHWETTRHIFGPSAKPTAEAIMFMRRSFDHPESWVPEEADDWDITGDWDVRKAAGIDGDPISLPAQLRDALARFEKRTTLDDPPERF